MWVYAGKYALWVTIMQARVCVCVFCGCASTLGQHVSRAKSLLAEKEGRNGFPLRIKSQLVAQCTFIKLIDAAYSTKVNSKRKMDTHAHFKSTIALVSNITILNYLWFGWCEKICNFTFKKTNAFMCD